jgi:hypothetical protein
MKAKYTQITTATQAANSQAFQADTGGASAVDSERSGNSDPTIRRARRTVGDISAVSGSRIGAIIAILFHGWVRAGLPYWFSD